MNHVGALASLTVCRLSVTVLHHSFETVKAEAQLVNSFDFDELVSRSRIFRMESSVLPQP